MDEDEVLDGLETEEAETTVETANPETPEEETTVKKVYIGPSVPRAGIRCGQILSGTEAEIAAYLAPLTEEYPEAGKLLAEPSALPEAQKRVRERGNLLHKYYQDMQAKHRASRMGG